MARSGCRPEYCGGEQHDYCDHHRGHAPDYEDREQQRVGLREVGEYIGHSGVLLRASVLKPMNVMTPPWPNAGGFPKSYWSIVIADLRVFTVSGKLFVAATTRQRSKVRMVKENRARDDGWARTAERSPVRSAGEGTTATVPGEDDEQALAKEATQVLRRRGHKELAISEQAVSSWFREGTPARSEKSLLALVDLLHTMSGPSAPPIRSDEWRALYIEAQNSPALPSGLTPGEVLDPTSQGAPGDRAPLEVEDHQEERPTAAVDGAERDHWLDTESGSALQAAVRGQTPSAAVAVFGRWWQLEMWLRDLLYLELRAKFGASWTSVLDPDVVAAVEGHRSRVGPDDANPLAQLSYQQLVAVIDEHWDVMSYALPTRRAWTGRQEELEQIRGRLGYLRRPHADDLGASSRLSGTSSMAPSSQSIRTLTVGVRSWGTTRTSSHRIGSPVSTYPHQDC